ncbi:PAS domain S-box-containing protein [Flexibacter flexilis DSM 6793]|uniref:histidine kinase n=1 Tax=Flexibacter flexilis DSM 6793 TaxID=927664 RepID=A0A1I1LB99_9BACT|nr:PAS domain S-box protein [Flexibacter flexilis]SFC66810.1 PAS domain S-box-containing protein [Flexibacter flexilis DSM 6793]
MERNKIDIQVLFELTLQQMQGSNIEQIIQNALPLYLKKLNCIMAGVCHEGQLRFVLPRVVQSNETERNRLMQLQPEIMADTQPFFSKLIDGRYYFVYKLYTFGHLILVRNTPFSDSIEKELGKVIDQLGRLLTQANEEKQLKLLQNLVNNSSDAFQISKEDGQLYYINNVAEKRLGIPRDKITEHNVKDFEKLFEDPQQWYLHVQDLKENGKQILEGQNINQETGEYFPVEVTVNTVEVEGQTFVIANSRDISERKEQEKQLLETKQQLESILNHLDDIIWSVSIPDNQLIFVTPSVEKLFGFSVEHWKGNSDLWTDIIYADDKRIIRDIYYDLAHNGTYDVRYRIVTGAGQIKWVRNRGKFVYNDAGVAIRLDGVIMDKTKLYTAESSLQQELHLQETLTDIASTYINLDVSEIENTINQSLRKMGQFVDADRAYIFDYDFEKNTTSNTYEWCNEGIESEINNLQNVPMEYFPQWVEQHRKGLPFYIPDVSKLIHTGAHGLKAILQAQGIKSLMAIPMIDKEELIGFVGFDSVRMYHNYSEKETRLLTLFAQMLINVRSRQRWQKQLILQEEKFRNIIANMDLGLLEIDNNGGIVFFNQSFSSMFGYSLDKLQGFKLVDVLSDSDKEIIMQRIEQRQAGLTESYEYKTRSKDGSDLWLFISGAPNYNDKGQVTGSISIFLDITEQKVLEEQLAQAKSFAEAAAKAKELFLANMSHEIRTPLNVIIGMIRQLSKEQLSLQQSFYVKHSETAAKHLLTILNNILDIAKIESGELQIISKEFSLSVLAYNVHSIMHSQVKEKNLKFKLNVSPDLKPALLGDETRIRQVLINLIGNAIKFTDFGAISINVKVWQTTATHQRVSVEVEDSGIGMSQAFLGKIFDKFSQEQNNANRRYEGTGLGLAISNDLVRLMGGQLTVQSQKGQGSVFGFELDLPIGNEKNLLTASTHIQTGAFKGKKVLMAEDNEMNRFIARQSLEYLGFEIMEAENGQMAVDIVRAQRFDLILMDIQMPIMDGEKATEIIRKELKIDTPIIALTANAFRHDIDKYLDKGMNDFIIKPYDEDYFIGKIQHVLGGEAVSIKEAEQLARAEMKMLEAEKPTNGLLYDLTYLEKMSRGNKAFVDKMVSVFVEQTKQTMTDLVEALEAGQIDRINKVSHKAKASIDQMGIKSLYNTIRVLEKFDPESKDKESLRLLIGQTNQLLQQTIDQLTQQSL